MFGYIMHWSIGQIIKIIMVLAKKKSKSVTTTIQLLLEIKVMKKVQNSQNISGS